MKVPKIEIEIKFSGAKKTELKQITSSQDCFELAKLLFDKSTIDWTEEMILVCLNRANKVIGYYKLSSGGTAGTVCDPKVIFTIALQACASSIILMHNHPSGNNKPSQSDIDITKKIKLSGEILTINLLDHIIICDDDTYYSFADEMIL